MPNEKIKVLGVKDLFNLDTKILAIQGFEENVYQCDVLNLKVTPLNHPKIKDLT